MKLLYGVYVCRFCHEKVEAPISKEAPDNEIPIDLNALHFKINPEKNEIDTWEIKNEYQNRIELIILRECDNCSNGISLFDLVKIKTKFVK